jgi:hypothetical protein
MNLFQKENLSQYVITPLNEYQTKEEKRRELRGGH